MPIASVCFVRIPGVCLPETARRFPGNTFLPLRERNLHVLRRNYAVFDNVKRAETRCKSLTREYENSYTAQRAVYFLRGSLCVSLPAVGGFLRQSRQDSGMIYDALY
ncbi:hypothetical protein Zmor_010086 [Zophobas morio]|uniref:Uncharacterized protein n=1 Tax=Zophobas morio TaxID=2755281 RepID=A0AA38MJD6_9CUCU|nr:hypothetical protein Zmor_010086 [Zophobas morio]